LKGSFTKRFFLLCWRQVSTLHAVWRHVKSFE